MKIILLMLAFYFSNGILFASNDPVDDFVERYMKKNQIPGVALLVVQDGKVVRSQGYGLANLEHKAPVKPETIFQSGSVGKQFTATAIMMLAEEGKLSVEDPISKYLKVPDSWKEIRIRHMLTHTSGLGDYPENFDMRKDYTEDEIFKIITSQPLGFAPGTQWKYSNLAYVTLGILIHKVSGKFYGDYLKERVFQPLGMNHTRVINEADIIPNRASGYRLDNGEIKNQEWVSPSLNTTADGSLYFSIEDLAKWDAALNSETLLKKTSFDQMWTPVVLINGKEQPYGFGWALNKTSSGQRLIEHGGSWQGFETHIARYPAQRLTVIALCNLAGADPSYITHKVAGIYKPEVAPAKHQAKEIDPEILKSYEGEYQLEERLTLKVRAQNGRLICDWRGQQIEMIPESETDFFEEDSERTYRFEKVNGKVTSMKISLGIELELRKIQ